MFTLTLISLQLWGCRLAGWGGVGRVNACPRLPRAAPCLSRSQSGLSFISWPIRRLKLANQRASLSCWEAGPDCLSPGTAAGQLPGSPPGHWLEVTAAPAACDLLPQLSAQLSQLLSAALRPSQLLYHTAKAAHRSVEHLTTILMKLMLLPLQGRGCGPGVARSGPRPRVRPPPRMSEWPPGRDGGGAGGADRGPRPNHPLPPIQRPPTHQPDQVRPGGYSELRQNFN